MDFHLDALLNFPHITIESCIQQEQGVLLKLRCLNEQSDCPDCPSHEVHQNRPRFEIYLYLVNLSNSKCLVANFIALSYFTERLSFIDWERRIQRYEEYLYQQVQSSNIEQVSRTENLSWDQVHF